MPAALEIRDSLPRTAVGKLSKKELIESEKQKYRMRTAPIAEAPAPNPPLHARS
jgi:acyl-CoA synthetase (AMP-forming)/AMP-acid ligase II